MFLHRLTSLGAFFANLLTAFEKQCGVRAPLIGLLCSGVAAASAADGDLNLNRSFMVGPANGYVSLIAKAPEGKLVVAGPFGSIDGHVSAKVVRFYQNGAVDRTFISTGNGSNGDDVRALAVQFDGRVVVGGLFTQFAGHSAQYLARLTEDGLFDPTFHFHPQPGDQIVSSIATLPDGRMMVAGSTFRDGIPRGFCRRLLADGSEDASFQLGVNGFITGLMALPDGKVLLGGANFRVPTDTDRYRVVRLNADGSWDSTWNYGLIGSSGGIGVSLMSLWADGALVIGVPGFTIGPALVERILSDGTVDSGFHPGTVGNNYTIADLDVQADGKILVALNHSQTGAGMLVRLSSDGSLDTTFSANASGNANVRRIGLLADGTAMIFGGFTTWNGVALPGIARLSAVPTRAHVFSMSRSAGADELWEGAHQEFSVVAGGTADPTYEWSVNGNVLPGESGEKLILNAVTPGQAGSYNVSVSNVGGSDVGAGFQLSVKSGPPELLSDFLEDVEGVVGGRGVLKGFAVGGPLPRYQWFKDGVAIDGQTGSSLVLSNLPAGVDASIFTLLAQNSHGSITSAPLHFLIRDYGSIFPDFALEKLFTARFNPPSSGCVLSPAQPWPSVIGANAIAVQRDGRIAVGGGFLNNSWVTARIQRLMPDGSQDTSFPSALSADAPAPDSDVDAVAIGVDDSIWIGGRFRQVNFQPRFAIARLKTTGALDQNFAPAFTVNGQPGGEVKTFARQIDGKMIAAGNFETVNGSVHPFIVRFNLDGSVDESFQGSLQYYSYVEIGSIALQGAKILVGSSGALSTAAPGKLIRLNNDGSIDKTFSAPPAVAAFTEVTAIAVDPHGRILVGAGYASPGDPSRPSILRLTDDGDVDPVFNAAPNQGNVMSIAVQPNGRIVIGGQFPSWGDNQTHSVARLRPDGSVDESFVASSLFGTVSAIKIMTDGLLGAGSFQPDERVAGKIGDCTLSAQDNGLVKLKLGDITVSEDPPDILVQPSGGIFAGGDVTLHVTAVGAQPFSYSWSRNGRALSFADGPSYTIANARPEDTAEYRVRVSNKFGSVLSEGAQVDILSSFGGSAAPTVGASGFKFNLALANGGHFEVADVQNVQLQMSEDLELWQTIDAQIQLVNGEVQLVDPGAVLKPQRFYRFVWGTAPPPPPTAVSDNSDLVAIESLPAVVRHAAELHLQEFIKPPVTGHNATVGEAEWIGVNFAPQARYLYDPAYHDGNDPAYVEFKMVHTRSQTPRGYMLVSMNEEDFPIIEFSTAGSTKTERVLGEANIGTVHKFYRLTPGFYSGEDASGNLVTKWGTPPAKADLTPLGTTARLDMSFDSESGTVFLPPRAQRAILAGYASYSELKNDLKTSPERVRIRSLRVAQAATHWVPVRGETYPTVRVTVGETNVLFPTQVYTSARVDADDDLPNVSAAPLRAGGVQVVGLRAGNDIVRLRTAAGSVLAYSIIVDPKGLLSQKQFPPIANSDCEDSSNQDFWAGTGWDGDQRQYWQMKDNFLWCPVVGCGPTALTMLLGWWDYNGVPSAFYRLKTRNPPLLFRFDYSSLRNSDAPKRFYDTNDPDGYALMHDVYEDIFDLCNTMCLGGEGATYPDQMASAFIEYILRVANPQFYPMNEFGDRFVGADIHAHWVPPGGMTDWEGGGTLVADGIKAQRPGVVGIGLTLFDAHYTLAYVYRRHSHYVGCGSDRHRDSLSRFFKCNMGWGPPSPPEWTNAENVWFGLTANLYQKKLPLWTVKIPINVPGVLQ